MQYGHFDNEKREYVIDRVDLPASWTNYLGLKNMCAVVNHTAGGYLFYKTPEYHRITRFRGNSIPMDRPGHYVYIRDNADGDYWSISWQPVGKSLEEVAAIAQRFADNMATLAVAVSGATHPATGSLLADLGEDEMEIGMGQHGEGGGGRQTMKSADETAKIMLDGLLADLDIREGEKIMLILNGTGATTLMELFIIYRRCVSYLKEKNIEIVANYVGELLTVQEQAGFQMFMARMDDELLHYWNAPCNTPYMKK